MSSAPSRPLWQGRALALVGIVLFAFSLRSAVASLSPVLAFIEADFAVPPAVIGLIGTAPPVCYAVFGILTPQLERRFGLERLALTAMVVVVAGLGWRGLATDSITLLLSTALIFAAVGVGNILLPPLVKKYFPDRIGLMTTIYSTTMAVATFTPPLVAVPVADAAGWRLSLGLWAVFAVVAMIPWIALLVRQRAAGPDEDIESASPQVFGRMWRLPLAWALMVGFTVSGTLAYTSFAWLPTLLVDTAGVSPAAAGALLSLFAAMGLPASLLVPVLVVRYNATRALFAVAVVTGLAGHRRTAVRSRRRLPGCGSPCSVSRPCCSRSRSCCSASGSGPHEAAVALSSFVQSVGYAIVALFPFGIGLLHGATDSWTWPLIILAVVVAAAIPAGAVAARRRTIEDDWERRHGDMVIPRQFAIYRVSFAA